MIRFRHTALSIVCVLSVLSPALMGQASFPADLKREHFQNAEVIYDWVHDSHGNRLRTFVTRPKGVTGKVPAIFFVGWLSCDSVEYPDGETDGFGAIFHRLIEQSGYATLRLDKPGVGESQGDCGKTDFATELSGYQAAFDEMFNYDFIDPAKVFVVGLSNGGGTSALVPRQHPVRGYGACVSGVQHVHVQQEAVHHSSFSKRFTSSDVTGSVSAGTSKTTRPLITRVFTGALRPRRTSSERAFPIASDRFSA
jgi:pimeloyl-ACP methyl ester carboxylesterase